MCLLGVGVPSEGGRERDRAPVLGADEVCRLVQLGCQVQEVDPLVGDHDGVYLHVSEVQVDVYTVEGEDEGCQYPEK